MTKKNNTQVTDPCYLRWLIYSINCLWIEAKSGNIQSRKAIIDIACVIKGLRK